MQRIELDDHGVIRFRMNKIIRDAVDLVPSTETKSPSWTIRRPDRMQLAQLIGYSASGYGDLSYFVAEVGRALRTGLPKSFAET